MIHGLAVAQWWKSLHVKIVASVMQLKEYPKKVKVNLYVPNPINSWIYLNSVILTSLKPFRVVLVAQSFAFLTFNTSKIA